jgi:hypothetical protein
MAEESFISNCTYAERLQSESGGVSREYKSSTRSSLSYLEACILGCTDFMDIVPRTNTENESTLWNLRIKPATTENIYDSTCESAKEKSCFWLTNRLETRAHQVQSVFPTYLTTEGQTIHLHLMQPNLKLFIHLGNEFDISVQERT